MDLGIHNTFKYKLGFNVKQLINTLTGMKYKIDIDTNKENFTFVCMAFQIFYMLWSP